MSQLKLLALALCLPAPLVATGCGSRTGLSIEEDGAIGCQSGETVLYRAVPSVMFVVDRSTSMTNSITTATGTATRWEAMRDALSTTLPGIDTSIKLGALFFPSDSVEESCNVSTETSLVPATGNVSALIELMNKTSPGGATPTAVAIESAGQVLRNARAARGGRALILATDGSPDCNAALDPSTCRCVAMGRPNEQAECHSAKGCLDDTRTVQAISVNFETYGIPTYVIGIEDPESSSYSDVLSAMAEAGGRAQTESERSYYAASSGTELEAALVAVRDQVGSCIFLTDSVPDAGGSIQLSLNEVRLSPDAWSFSSRDNGEILLGPALCRQLAAAPDQTLVAQVTCMRR